MTMMMPVFVSDFRWLGTNRRYTDGTVHCNREGCYGSGIASRLSPSATRRVRVLPTSSTQKRRVTGGNGLIVCHNAAVVVVGVDVDSINICTESQLYNNLSILV